LQEEFEAAAGHPDPEGEQELREPLKEVLESEGVDTSDVGAYCAARDIEHETTLCLDEAKQVVCGDRARDYGKPSVNHRRTADLIGAYLGIPITPRQVCVINILQKISRDAHEPKRDNLVDIAGYAQNAAWVEDSDRNE